MLSFTCIYRIFYCSTTQPSPVSGEVYNFFGLMILTVTLNLLFQENKQTNSREWKGERTDISSDIFL